MASPEAGLIRIAGRTADDGARAQAAREAALLDWHRTAFPRSSLVLHPTGTARLIDLNNADLSTDLTSGILLSIGVTALLAGWMFRSLAVVGIAVLVNLLPIAAIAGVMGAYFLLFPRARVDVLFFFIIFFRVIPIPAWIMLAIWFGLQVVSGVLSPPGTGGVAHWAHAGGFAAGLVMTFPLWLIRGGPAFWNRNNGSPPHPEAVSPPYASRIPSVRRAK